MGHCRLKKRFFPENFFPGYQIPDFLKREILDTKVHVYAKFRPDPSSRLGVRRGRTDKQTNKPTGVLDLRIWQPQRVWLKNSAIWTAMTLDCFEMTIFSEIFTRVKCLKRTLDRPLNLDFRHLDSKV